MVGVFVFVLFFFFLGDPAQKRKVTGVSQVGVLLNQPYQPSRDFPRKQRSGNGVLGYLSQSYLAARALEQP